MTRSPDDVVRVGALPVPSASQEVVRLLQQAAGPPVEDEYRDQSAAVAAFVAASSDDAAMDAAVTSSVGEGRTSRHATTIRRIRVTAAALLASLVLGGGLAAADVLPAPAQRFVSGVLGSVGIPVPSPEDRSPRSGTGSPVRPVDAEHPAGPDQSPAGVMPPAVLPDRAEQPPSGDPGAADRGSSAPGGASSSGGPAPSSTGRGAEADARPSSGQGSGGSSDGAGSASDSRGGTTGPQRSSSTGGNGGDAPGQGSQTSKSSKPSSGRSPGTRVTGNLAEAPRQVPEAAGARRTPGR